MIRYSDSEVENSRQETLRRLFGDILNQGEGFGNENIMIDPGNYTTGTVGYHEAIHTSKLVANLIDNDLLEHPTIALSKEAYALAMRAHTSLMNLALLLIDVQEENP